MEFSLAGLVCGCAAMAAVVATAAPGGATALSVNLDVNGLVSSAVAHSAFREAARLWQPYRVELRESTDTPALTVTLDLSDGNSPDALGQSFFDEQGPMPFIAIHFNAVQRAVTQGRPFGIDGALAPEPVRDRVVARVLGRAIAHEVGHYLLRWEHHAASGLMRAQHRPAELADPRDRAYALTPLDVERLAASLRGPALAGLQSAAAANTAAAHQTDPGIERLEGRRRVAAAQ